MKRVLSAVKWDINFQLRYGFYYAYIVVSVVYIIAFRQIPQGSLKLVVPFIIFSDPAILGFYFIGGLILLEKGEGTLEYLVITPLGSHEYLLSKIVSLTLLSGAASVIVTVLGYGTDFNFILLFTGIILTSTLFVLIGFIAVARFKTVNNYLMTSIIYMTILNIPALDFFGIVKNMGYFYIFPTQASLILMKAAFNTVETWRIIYSIVYLMIWIWAAYVSAYRSFCRFIVSNEGGR